MPDIALQDLQNVRYTIHLPIQFTLNNEVLECEQLLRVVPAKRLVFLGHYQQQKVIIKLFVHCTKAKKHWQREMLGAKLLNEHQILTPEIMLQGVSEKGFYYLIFPYIEGQNLAQFWQKSSTQQRMDQLKNLMSVLAQHHRAGLAHQDLHYANFYLGDDQQIVTLDGEEVTSYSSLNQDQRLNNLALFLAQTFDITATNADALLKEYCHISSVVFKKKKEDSFWSLIKQNQQQRIHHYLKKVLRDCTEVVYKKQKNSYSLCRREYHNTAIQDLLKQPEHYFQNDDSAFLKQGNTCTVKSVLVDNKRYVIKRYNPKGKRYELTHKGRHSRARKSWLNAHLLRFMGILTPEPIALIEQYEKLGQRCSYFICQYQAGVSSWDFFCESSKDKVFIEQQQSIADKLLSVLTHLGDYKITHGDLKGSNFLIDQDKVYLLDLDGMKQHRYQWTFNKSWQRDQQRFLKNWDKKACYAPWKIYFNDSICHIKA